MPGFYAGIAAGLDGAHDLVVGRAVVVAEARVLVVEAVEDDGAVVIGEGRRQLAKSDSLRAFVMRPHAQRFHGAFVGVVAILGSRGDDLVNEAMLKANPVGIQARKVADERFAA